MNSHWKLLLLAAGINLFNANIAFAERGGGNFGSRGPYYPEGVYPIVVPNIATDTTLAPPVTVQNGPNGATQTQVGNTTYYSPGGSSVTNGNRTTYSNGTTCVVNGNQKTCN